MISLPYQSEDLIEELDRMYPPKCVEPGQTLEEAQRYAGRRALIDELLYLREVTLEDHSET